MQPRTIFDTVLTYKVVVYNDGAGTATFLRDDEHLGWFIVNHLDRDTRLKFFYERGTDSNIGLYESDRHSEKWEQTNVYGFGSTAAEVIGDFYEKLGKRASDFVNDEIVIASIPEFCSGHYRMEFLAVVAGGMIRRDTLENISDGNGASDEEDGDEYRVEVLEPLKADKPMIGWLSRWGYECSEEQANSEAEDQSNEDEEE